MFWSKKKKIDKGLPDLPAMPNIAPSIRDYKSPYKKFEEPETENEEFHALPSFPDSLAKKGFSQTAIKDAVIHPDNKYDLPELPDSPIPKTPFQKARTVELDEWHPETPSAPPPLHLEKPKLEKAIFVKLEKFQAARESLETIEEKLSDIDELLRTIKEVKQKEDSELTSWEKEIESIKSRISFVNAEIFDRSEK